jgi:hypothetical protein
MKTKELENIFPKGCPIEVHYGGWVKTPIMAKVHHVEISESFHNRIYYMCDDENEKIFCNPYWTESGVGITGPHIVKCK